MQQSSTADSGIVIIGSGLAGYNLAREFRKLDKQTPLTIISEDDGRSYSKPMLSTGYSKGKRAAELAMANPQEMAEQLNAVIKPTSRVQQIDRQAQSLQLASGETINYTKLVLALGAEVISPPLKGDAVASVVAVNDLQDYEHFRRMLDQATSEKPTAQEKAEEKKTVLIIGAGLIGCEFANDLSNGGFQVQVVDPMTQLLPTLLPETAAKAVQRGLEALGVKFDFGPLVESVDQHGDKLKVTLSNGQQILVDHVLSAIGLKPRLALAKAMGLATDRGIVVDRELKTNDPNIFALGDCAEVAGHVLFYVLPLMACARSLAKTLNQQPTEVQYGVMPITIKTPANPVVVMPPPKGSDGRWHFEGDELNVKACFYDASKQLLGYALTGDYIKEKMALSKLISPLMP